MSTIRLFAPPLRSLASLALLASFFAAPPGRAQNSTQPQPQQPAQQPDQAAPESGGPGADAGSIALPKKKEKDEPPPAPAAPKFKNPEGAGDYSLRVDVPEVTVDVGVLLEKTGQFVPNLKPANFKVYEDGVEQKVSGFKRIEAPITALLVCEFASTSYYFHLRHAQRCVVFCAAAAAAGLRGADDLRHAYAASSLTSRRTSASSTNHSIP